MEIAIELINGTEVKTDDLGCFEVDGNIYSLDDFEFQSDRIVKSPDGMQTDRWIHYFKNCSNGSVLAKVNYFFHAQNKAVTMYYFSIDGHFTVLF